MKKGITFFIKIICSFLLGIVANKILTTFSMIKILFFEVIKENPFIYTISIREMLYFYSIVTFILILITTIIYDDKESKLEIAKLSNYILKIEIIIFSFILGTQIFSKKNINLEFLEGITLLDISIVTLFSIFNFLIYIFSLEKNSKESIEKSEEIYESRKFLLGVIENNLKNMEAFSIIGDWGIGKSVLVKNFFYKNKKEYELIFIDSSIYSSNEKIVATLESKILNLLKKYNIFVRNKNIEEEIFIQSNNLISTIYNFLFRKTTVEDYRKEISKKVEHIKKLGKTTVICLDNLERLGSKERIKNLFAIINELFPENIKKIYIYDEKEMERLFNLNNNSEKNDKKSNEFIKYIEKYTFNKIEITKTPFEEILNASLIKNFKNDNSFSSYFIKEFFNEINEKISSCLKIDIGNGNLKENSPKIYEIISKNAQKKLQFDKKLSNISTGIKNPRYLNNLLSDVKKYSIQNNISNNKLVSFYDMQKIIKYKLEYRIIKDFLVNIKKEDIITSKKTYFDVINDSTYIDNNIDNDEIENLCLICLFGLDILFRENIDNFRRRTYYECFFDNSNTNKIESSIDKKLITLKENSSKNLFKIIEYIIFIYPENYISEIKKFLEKTNFKYVINEKDEIKELIHLTNIEEYFEELFPKIKIKENILRTRISEVTYLDDEVRDFLEHNNEISYLLKLTEYQIKNSNNIKNDLEYLLNKAKENERFFNKINLYKKINKFLNMLKSFLEIKIEVNKDNFIDIDIETLEKFTGSENDFFYNIKVEKEKMIVEDNNRIQIFLSEKDILKLEEKYLKKLQEIISKEDYENKKLLSKIRLFLIQVEKFKNQNMYS